MEDGGHSSPSSPLEISVDMPSSVDDEKSLDELGDAFEGAHLHSWSGFSDGEERVESTFSPETPRSAPVSKKRTAYPKAGTSHSEPPSPSSCGGVRGGRCKRPERCAMCGRPAHGYHYGAQACAGCKTFFHRALRSTKNIRCKIDLGEAHENCRFCRVLHCIQCGMDPYLVQKKESINKDFLARLEPFLQETLTRRLELIEERVDCLRRSHFNVTPREGKSIAEIASEQPLEPGIKLDANVLDWIGKDWLAVDVHCSMEYLKLQSGFARLPIDQKVARVKAATILLTNLTRAYYAYELGSPRIMFPDGNHLSFPSTDSFSPLLHMTDTSVLEKLHDIRPTREEYILLKAVVSCYQEQPEEESVKCVTALMDCCLRRGAADRYLELHGIMEALLHQRFEQSNARTLQAVMTRGASESQIIREVFDL